MNLRSEPSRSMTIFSGSISTELTASVNKNAMSEFIQISGKCSIDCIWVARFIGTSQRKLNVNVVSDDNASNLMPPLVSLRTPPI